MPTFGAKHNFTLPFSWPSDGQQEHENWVAIERWANTFGQTPYDAAFFDIVCDGTKNSYTFNVPNIYTHLWYEIAGSTTSVAANITMGFNNDVTDAHYDYTILAWVFGAASATVASGSTRPPIAQLMSDTSRTQGCQGLVYNYNSQTMKKLCSIFSSAVSASVQGFFGAGQWEETTAISSIQLLSSSGNFASGTAIKFGGVW
jgi:hypothetical protein